MYWYVEINNSFVYSIDTMKYVTDAIMYVIDYYLLDNFNIFLY